jgi:hypothetical protein
MGNKRRIKIGDIYAIPLPNGKYAYGRVFKDAGIGIYNKMGENIEDIPKEDDYMFIVGVYRDVLQSGDWNFVINKKFETEEDAWPPKMANYDMISKKYNIYYKGEFSPSIEDECKDLEVAAIWDSHHIIDRIMGNNKWHKEPN